MDVNHFYNQIANKYTSLIERSIPNYAEMLTSLFSGLPSGFKPGKVLELGCGSGNLSEMLQSAFPNSELHLVDISKEMIKQCKQRLKHSENIRWIESSFEDLEVENDTYDLILSTISIHHLKDKAKSALFERLHNSLKDSGIVIFSDQCRGSTQELYVSHLNAWKREALKLGSNEEDWNIWMEHQEKHDFHATIQQHFDWLKEAGFKNIDLLWKKLLWTVFYSEK